MTAEDTERLKVNVRLAGVTDDTFELLEDAGLEIGAFHKFIRVVNGSIEEERLPDLMECEGVQRVEQVRTVKASSVESNDPDPEPTPDALSVVSAWD